MSEWLDFTSEEPIGEERADLRTGALATVIWNTSLDTKKMGGQINPTRYVVGWGRDRNHIMTLKPKEKIQTDTENLPDQTLNNKSKWSDFKANMKAYARTKKG